MKKMGRIPTITRRLPQIIFNLLVRDLLKYMSKYLLKVREKILAIRNGDENYITNCGGG
jgi:hypothetical protein